MPKPHFSVLLLLKKKKQLVLPLPLGTGIVQSPAQNKN